MRMDRRSFLKGMLAISAAAVVLPMLPAAEIEAAAPSILETAPIIEFTSKMGRLGRVRIDRSWFPLEDAWFTMFRRYAPLRYPSDAIYDVRRPLTEQEAKSSFVPAHVGPLVNSPWKVQIWTPDQEVGSFFANMNNLEFEFDTRQASFIGNGYLTEMQTENVIGRDIDEDALLFSISLEGDEKLRRFGEVRKEDLEI